MFGPQNMFALETFLPVLSNRTQNDRRTIYTIGLTAVCCTHTQVFLIRTAYGLARNVAGDVKSLLGKCGEHAGSIPDCVIGKFSLNNPSGRTMSLRLSELLIEMSTGNISWGKDGR
jgi:hypothetical protein